MTKKTVLEVDTSPAVKSIGELRNNIKELKKQLNEQDLSSPEGMAKYGELLKELNANQNVLRDSMHATSSSWKELTEAATGANIAFKDNGELVSMEGVSYNALVHKLKDLTEAWRSTQDASERAKLGSQIKSVNDELKGMDESVGKFGRNVGNYIGAVDHLTAGLASMGKGAASIINPIKGVTAGLKTMSATPVVAILGLLASVLQQVMGAMKSSEANAQGLAQALAPLSALGDLATKVLQALGGIVVKVAEGFGKLTAAIFGTNEATEKRLELAKQEAQLAEQQRKTIIANAEAERDVAELRAKSSDKANYSAAERLRFLEQAGEKERQIAERALEDAKLQYEIIRDRNALTKSSKEELDKEAQAYADMVKAETAYYNQIRTINSGISRARKEEERDARNAAKAVKDAATAKINAEKEYLSQLLATVRSGSESELKIRNEIAKKEYEAAVANARQKVTDAKELQKTLDVLEQTYELQRLKNKEDYDEKVRTEELKALRNRAETYRRGSVEYLAAVEEVAARDYDTMKRKLDETDAEWEARRLAAARALAEAQQETADAVVAEGRLVMENEMQALAEGSVDQLRKAVEIAAYDIDNLHQQIDETDDEFLARRLAKQDEYRAAVEALDTAEVEQGKQAYLQRIATLEEGSLAMLDAQVELKKYELDTLHQLEGESEDEFRTRQLEADKAYYAAKKAQAQAWLQTMSTMASGVSGILGGIADMMEANTDMTESEARKAKNLRIAGATIDMLNGAVTAYATAQSLGVPMGPIVGAINAAAVITAGMANIAKIKATQVSKNVGGTATAPTVPASVQAPLVMPEIAQVRTVTSASEEDRLNRIASEQRVYILQSDLEAEREDRRVQVAETTW